MRASPIRFTGMASGMDTDSIVRDMMRPQQYKIDNRKKEQALLQLKQDAWKDMNKKLFDFHRTYTEKMNRGTAFNKNKVTSSNSEAISVDENTIIPEGTHTFEITQLAESARAVGQGIEGKGLEGNPKISELVDGGFTIFPTLSLKVNGKSITVNISESDTLSKVAEKMNTQLRGIGKGTNDNKVDTGFRASYDEKNGGFFINSTATGVEQTIEFSSDNSEGAKLFNRLGFDTSKVIRGQDAKYKYNKSDTEFTSSTNKISINGVNATLQSANTGLVSISSAPDTESIYTWVKDFVAEYNKLIDEINEKLDTRPGKDVMPLTAEERDSMSESEIKLWEDKINNSLFYKDPELTSFADSARRILSSVLNVEENEDGTKAPNSLASLGIVTGSWQEKGRLYILGEDDDILYADKPNKLREAIETNPNQVTDFFRKIGNALYSEHNKTFTSSNKLKSSMNYYNDKVIQDKIRDFDKQISTLEERMYRMEDMQYARFAAMEKMLSALNNQSSWLSQQFGGY